jgi:hypothetical protein
MDSFAIIRRIAMIGAILIKARIRLALPWMAQIVLRYKRDGT